MLFWVRSFDKYSRLIWMRHWMEYCVVGYVYGYGIGTRYPQKQRCSDWYQEEKMVLGISFKNTTEKCEQRIITEQVCHVRTAS